MHGWGRAWTSTSRWSGNATKSPRPSWNDRSSNPTGRNPEPRANRFNRPLDSGSHHGPDRCDHRGRRSQRTRRGRLFGEGGSPCRGLGTPTDPRRSLRHGGDPPRVQAFHVGLRLRPPSTRDQGGPGTGLLRARGTRVRAVAVPSFPDRRFLLYRNDPEWNQREVARYSKADAKALPRYEKFWEGVGELLEPTLLAPPVPLADPAGFVSTPEAEEFLRRILFMSIAEVLDEYFESEEVKASLATSAVAGTMAGPRTPGTAFVLGHHTLGDIGGG